MSLRLRIHDLPPPDEPTPLPERLVQLLRAGIDRGGAPPVAVIERPNQTHLVPLKPAAEAGLPPGQLLAGLTQARFDDDPYGAEAIGLMGRFQLRRRGEDGGVPMAQVFVEWPDCSWWHWRVLLSVEGGIRDDTVTVRAAAKGDPLPAQLGRWWSTGRRRRLRMHLRRRPAVPVTESAMVH